MFVNVRPLDVDDYAECLAEYRAARACGSGELDAARSAIDMALRLSQLPKPQRHHA